MYKIKIAGIYIIEHVSGYYYIGMSIDIFSRWQSHITSHRIGKHSSTKFMELFNSTPITEWSFNILEHHSYTEFKNTNGVKNSVVHFRRFLLTREKICMSLYSVNNALNKNTKYFS